MRLRARGYPLFLLGAFLFARSAGGPFPYFAFYLAAAVFVLAWFWAGWLARRFTVLVTAEGRAFSIGDTVDIAIRMENDSPLPVPWLVLQDESGAAPGKGERLVLGVLPFSERRLHRPVTFERRGRYRPGPVDVVFGDPVGLFEVRRRVEGREQFVVYPNALPVDDLPLHFRQPFGRLPTRLRAHQDPSSLADVRPLVPGDSPRFIHWKVSAKRGSLHVREFELRATTSVLVILDMQRAVQAGTGSQRTDETAASLALGVAAYGLRQDLSIGLLASGRRRVFVPPGRGDRHFRELRERLVDAAADGSIPLAQWLQREQPVLVPGSSLLVVTPRLDRHLVGHLTRTRRAGFDVVVVHLLSETFDPMERPEPLRARLWEALQSAGVALVRLGADGLGLEAFKGAPGRARAR